MSEVHVTGIGARQTLEIGGRRYVLRPISYGEAVALEQQRAGIFQGGPAMLAEVVRQALADAGAAARHIEAVDAHEAADDAVTCLLINRPHQQEPAEAHAEWRERLRPAQVEALRANRRRTVAEAQVATAPAVVAARAELAMASLSYRMGMLRAALDAWSGEGLEPWSRAADGEPSAAVIETLPAAEVEQLFELAERMRRPGPIEGKP
jgi:hypothetical protein